MKRKNRVGEKYGRLLVLGLVDFGDTKGGLWKCRCDCGTEKNVTGAHLRDPRYTPSCGCLRRELKSAGQRKYQATTIHAQYRNHLMSAKEIKSDPLNKEVWKEICVKLCFYCGEIDVRSAMATQRDRNQRSHTFSEEELKKYEVKINGVDRIDSSKGYEISNCIPCCKMCNWMKNGFLLKSFVRKAKQIAAHVTDDDIIKLNLPEQDVNGPLNCNRSKSASVFK